MRFAESHPVARSSDLRRRRLGRTDPGKTPLPRGPRRRGAIMIFVLGVLVLLALLGLLLIARTHGESKRVAYEATGSSEDTAMDGVVETVRQTLRSDIWGTPPSAQPLNSTLGSTPSLTDPRENNEPYDTPGAEDRWLASTLPYYAGDKQVNNPPVIETGVLAWYRVSYMGGDVIAGTPAAPNPYRWRTDARTGLPRAAKVYKDSDLSNVLILQTPPPGMTGNMIPGSTTNRTIAAARRAWQADPPTVLDGVPLNVVPRFPYFDTNADGLLDLYDADGDGVPDSPISFVVPIKTSDPKATRDLYAAIRIVDHASMLNVNVASSLRLPTANGLSPALTFDETTADLQRRGRRMTELLLDDTVHPDDALLGGGSANNTSRMVYHRCGDYPAVYDRDIVRTSLAGGRSLTAGYFLYGLTDEQSLRHRNLLVPPDRVNSRTVTPASLCTIDGSLPGTLLWSRVLAANGKSYDPGTPPRWTRLNSNHVDATNCEGYDDAGGKGWRSLLRDDEPYAIRRPLLTTVSHEVIPPPQGVTLAYDAGADEYYVSGLATNTVRMISGGSPTQLHMDWPFLRKADFPTVPAHLRLMPIDINMSNPADATGQTTKTEFIQYMAAAVYMALGPSGNYQGFSWGSGNALNREYLAWQFAANIADYRDSDGEPTVLEWVYDPVTPQSRYIHGIEKQPFFTEVYVRLEVGSGGGPVPGSGQSGGDKWFTAVELYVPPLWKISTANLYLRLPDNNPNSLIPLSAFTRPPPFNDNLLLLDGGPATGAGRYYVLCGSPVGADVTTTTFYRDSRLDVHASGAGQPGGKIELVYSHSLAWDPTDPWTHVLDVINPGDTGGILAGGSQGSTEFANRDAINPAPQPGDVHRWSLWRSTKGWRFTTGWQAYSMDGCGPVGGSGSASCCQSLGGPNNQACVKSGLDKNVPESVWPTLVSTATTNGEPMFPKPGGVSGFTLVAGFTSGQPFEAFDSPAEVSRLLMFGPVGTVAPPSCADVAGDTPVTVQIAKALMRDITDLPAAPADRAVAGRIDFAPVTSPAGGPWGQRLLSYLTTESPLYDGVDNDGNGLADLADLAAAHPCCRPEGVNVLNRFAGRININTAPVGVLRSIPFMSLLPTSAEYTHYLGGTPAADPANVFASTPGSFWDFASAIVSRREARQVPLRLPDASGVMRTVAASRVATPVGGSGSTSKPRPFVSTAEMTSMSASDVAPASAWHPMTRDDAFAPDRLWTYRAALAMYPHGLGGGMSYWSSPDFRYRDDGAGNGLIDYWSLGDALTGTSDDNGGLRSRDIFFARMANMVTTRSDVFTAYIALLDENGHYVGRSQVTLDRSVCFGEDPALQPRRPILPLVLLRQDGSYVDETK